MNTWIVHEWGRESFSVIEFNESGQRTGMSIDCGHSEVGRILAERLARLPELEAEVIRVRKALGRQVSYCRRHNEFFNRGPCTACIRARFAAIAKLDDSVTQSTKG